MAMILTALSNLSWPLFFLGFLAIAAGGVTAMILNDERNRRFDTFSDGWLMWTQWIKASVIAVLIGVGMILVSFAVDDINEPLIREVEKEVEVEVLPEFERVYNKCLAYNGAENLSYEDHKGRDQVIRRCQNAAADVIASSTGRPIKVVERNIGTRIVYRKLPYEEFMKACAPAGHRELKGEIPIQLAHKQVERCQDLAATKMNGLVQDPQ